MTRPNYTLEIISHHSDFKNRSLKKYQIEGIDTVGAWGNEPFEIRFKNNTYQKIQVKLSVDGTDILTGEPATTEVSKDMWVVNGQDTLSLKAWPENNNGGAQFIFTSANNSVAIHTHGDLSSRGIIAAAVFTEGHVETIKYNPIHVNHYHYPKYYDFWYNQPLCGGGTYTSTSIPAIESISYNNSDNRIGSSNSVFTCASNSDGEATMDCMSLNDSDSQELENLVAVGAGQYVNQNISYVQGLIKPLFTETVRVKYVWYDDLVIKLKEHNVQAPHASGFPGDKNKGINLGKTPRVGSVQRTGEVVAQPAYARF